MSDEKAAPNGAKGSGRDSWAEAAALWNRAFDEQVDDWQRATEKVARWAYGPAELLRDVQNASLRNVQLAVGLSRLWGSAWLTGMPGGMGSLEAERKAIQEQGENCRQAVAKRDAKAVAAYYTEDAIYANPAGPTLVGRAAIQGLYEGIFAMSDLTIEWHSTQPVAVAAGRDMAWELGETTLAGKPEGAPAIDFHGRYLLVWRKVDGAWLMAVDFPNTAPPPPAK
ncbi:MAG: SgcJ/EcaC family oxidoreductase [Thermoanaerobaculia bacterium]|nr:SgcJ/EcaC family oxidoreductase [Thermoanaerobaculia bacterium]